MHAKYDEELKMIMIGFEPEQLNLLTHILMDYVNAGKNLQVEANDICAFLMVAQLSSKKVRHDA